MPQEPTGERPELGELPLGSDHSGPAAAPPGDFSHLTAELEFSLLLNI